MSYMYINVYHYRTFLSYLAHECIANTYILVIFVLINTTRWNLRTRTHLNYQRLYKDTINRSCIYNCVCKFQISSSFLPVCDVTIRFMTEYGSHICVFSNELNKWSPIRRQCIARNPGKYPRAFFCLCYYCSIILIGFYRNFAHKNQQ